MQDGRGDLFGVEGADAICITTNGFVTREGANIMGAGCAGAAKRRWPRIDHNVGISITQKGNRTHLLTRDTIGGDLYLMQPANVKVPYHILTFPTKKEFCRIGELLPYYQSKARPNTQGQYP